ncbi:MAG: hypothetical protein AAF629_19980 [Chloroflexota bacterium]
MTKTLTFFHTSPVHIETFDQLLADLAPDIPAHHVVNEAILARAVAAGGLNTDLAQTAKSLIQEAITPQTGVLLCTCSTIGVPAENANSEVDLPLLRVDKPMAEEALDIGSRIIVAATVKTTLEPTQQLILDVAKAKSKEISLIPLLCADAWTRFERGDKQGYLQIVADSLSEIASQGDVIVLAQASMADAVNLAPALPIPVLSSPRLGLEAAIKAYRRVS